MTIDYNLDGANRKALVQALSTKLGIPANYMGVPSCAYRIGEYTVGKTGVLTGPDDRELVAGLVGFQPVSEEYDAALPDIEEVPDIDQHHPGQYADPDVPPTEEMLRQADAWMEDQIAFEDLRLTEREELGLGQERRDPPGEDGMQASDVPEPDGFSVDVPLGWLDPDALDRLGKMVAAKEALIKKALGADALPIIILIILEDRISFPWFTIRTPEEAAAYAQFINMLCKTAKEKKRITAKAQEAVDNERFAMRVFLIGLGLVGKEFSLARKLLISRLSGNCAFKTQASADAWQQKHGGGSRNADSE